MKRTLCAALAVLIAAATFSVAYWQPAGAQVPPPGPKSDSIGVEGTIPSPPPNRAASISTPSNGQAFTTVPVTVSGLCPDGTLIKLFSNEIFVGSTICTNGSYSLQIALFSGRNDLIARVFDVLDQQGPDSPVVSVTFTDARFAQFGSYVLLTSQYARRAANPNTVLEWPVVISSGLGPYALSADWGDGTSSDLRSEPFAGAVTLRHTYKTPGVYRVTFKVVDTNNTTGFLQVVAVARGEIDGNGTTGAGSGDVKKTIVTRTEIPWWPLAVLIVPIILTFWLGQRYAMLRLRRKLEREYR